MVIDSAIRDANPYSYVNKFEKRQMGVTMSNEFNLEYEALLLNQSSRLISANINEFNDVLIELIQQALEFFDMDRLIIYPNSIILLNEGKSVSVSRSNIPILDKEKYKSGNYSDYLKLLRSKKSIQTFTHSQLEKSRIDALKMLHSEGGCWHGIIRLELFGKVWGAVSFSRFTDDQKEFTEHSLNRFKLLCDTWLCYWQHANMSKGLQTNQDQADNQNENDKLMRLSKKQCAVLNLLAQGFTAKQCAEKLFLSPRTIESHKYRMLDLLELDNHTELIQFAIRNGLSMESD
jgi:DNA-binding CsgD family transcriptional regulator